jgi:uncharacterized protein (TIGR02145 family)
VLPAGGGSISGGVVYYSSLTNGAVFWTNEKIGDTEARSVSVYGKDKNPEFIEGNVNDRRSVRCLKGMPQSSSSSAKSSSSSQSSSSAKSSSSSVQSSSSLTFETGKESILGDQYSIVEYNPGETDRSVHQKWMAENLHYWDATFTSTQDTCYDKNYVREQDKDFNLCEIYGFYYSEAEALSILDKFSNDCWVLPDSQTVKALVGIVNGDLNQIYSVDMKGNNKSGFNLLSAGYYTGSGYFFPITKMTDPQLKTCFWIRTGKSDQLAASCFYSRSLNGTEAEKRSTEMTGGPEPKARLPIRLIYNLSCSQ